MFATFYRPRSVGDTVFTGMSFCSQNMHIGRGVYPSMPLDRKVCILAYTRAGVSAQGCACFAEIASELTKAWSSSATDFGV